KLCPHEQSRQPLLPSPQGTSPSQQIWLPMSQLGQSRLGGGKLQVQPCPQCPVSNGRPIRMPPVYIRGMIDTTIIGNAIEVARARALAGREFVAVSDIMRQLWRRDDARWNRTPKAPSPFHRDRSEE